jgi:hypothetical protein
MSPRVDIKRLCLLALLTSAPALAGDSVSLVNPFAGMKRVPLTAELELYAGGLTGLGSAYDSPTRPALGSRLTFGLFERLDLSANWLYATQPRATTVPWFPGTDLILRSVNLNVFFGSADLIFAQSRSTRFYVSPGLGFVRTGDRRRIFVGQGGGGYDPLPTGTAWAFNVGTGLRPNRSKRLGLTFDVRYHVSGAGKWDYPSAHLLQIPEAPTLPPVRDVPRQHSLVFTVGVAFKLR